MLAVKPVVVDAPVMYIKNHPVIFRMQKLLCL